MLGKNTERLQYVTSFLYVHLTGYYITVKSETFKSKLFLALTRKAANLSYNPMVLEIVH